MKKALQLLAVVMMALSITSCGGKKKTVAKTSFDLTPTQTEIKGYLSDVLEVVEGTYTFKYEGSDGIIQVKIKSVGRGNSNDHALNDGDYGPLYLAICDSLGKPIAGYENLWSEYTGDTLLKDMVGNVGEENWITFDMMLYGKNQLPDNTSKFYVFSKEASESSSTSSSTSGNKEWDKLLNDYEAYVDKYIAVVKKAASGNESAFDDAVDLEEKAEDLEDSLNAALDKNDLSSEQANRLAKIIAKFGKAMSDLDKAEDADWGDEDGDEW